MTVLVTGAAGFIGRHLGALLRSQRSTERVIGVDVRPFSHPGYDDALVADLLDARQVHGVIATTRPRVAIHLAGASRGSDDALMSSNAGTARALLDALHRARVDAATVLVGSAAEYGIVPERDQPVTEDRVVAPVSAYGRAKAEVTRVATQAVERGQRIMVARPFNVIGAGTPPALVAGAVAQRLRDALAGPSPRHIEIGRTDGVRDFVDVTDVARGLLAIAELGKPGQVYNLCSGVGHRIQELVDLFVELAAEPVDVRRAEHLGGATEVDVMIGSPARAEKELRWRPTVAFRDSVVATWQASAVRPVQ